MHLTTRSGSSGSGRLGLLAFIPAFALAAACGDPGTGGPTAVIEAPRALSPTGRRPAHRSASD